MKQWQRGKFQVEIGRYFDTQRLYVYVAVQDYIGIRVDRSKGLIMWGQIPTAVSYRGRIW